MSTSFADLKILAFATKVQNLEEHPKMDYRDLQAVFDASPEELRVKFNALLDMLDGTGSGEGTALDSLKLGGQLPAYYATVQALTAEIKKLTDGNTTVKKAETANSALSAVDQAARDAAESANDLATKAGNAASDAKAAAFSTYTHEKVETVHQLTLAGGGSNIKFVAAAAYNAGDTFLVNGAACTAKNLIVFAAGDVVEAHMADGNVLDFGQHAAYKKIWENASPTSSFEPQVISFAGGHYSIYIVQLRVNGTTDILQSGILIADDVSSAYNQRLSWSNYNGVMSTREFSASKNSIRVGTTYTPSATVNNAMCIPVAIYGIKGVQ